MGKKLLAVTVCVVVASVMAGPLAYAGDPTLIGWWKLNDGTGTTALDLSGNGHDGTVQNAAGGLGTGGSVWVDDPERGMVIGFNGTDGSGAYISTGLTIPAMTLENDFTWIFWTKQHASQATNNDTILGNRYGGVSSPLQFIKFTPTRFECYNDDGAYVNGINYVSIPGGVWVHHALVKDGASLTYYRDGVATMTNTMTKAVAANPFYMGADGFSGAAENWQGYLSDVRLYTRALTEKEVKDVIAGKGPNAELAGNPAPDNGVTDVPRDATLSWTAGEFAATHDVYLGTTLADVDGASRANPMGVLAGQDQTAVEFDPAGLTYGQTYYWRVDEVNAAPDSSIFKGEVWSFTAEPFSYPITKITATASSSQIGMNPQNTVNGSGLNDKDEHSVELTDMWTSTGVQPNWIQYEFDKVYKLDELWVWNSNQLIETFLGFGARNVTIEYSTDGATWTALEGVPEFAKATATPTYKANTFVDFGGAMAKFVKLTITKNWGGVAPQSGLSEVRFFAIPVQARAPQPADGATGVSVETALDWRPGREAGTHDVFLGTEADAVAAGTVAPASVAEHGFDPDVLNFGTTYFWKVNEVNATGSYDGEVWSFTTQEFAAVDDFESYNDDDNRIYDSWIDGLTDTAKGGSQVGYDVSPFAERGIVHGGKQALPLIYDNSASPFVSEAERTFASPRNWAVGQADTLSLYFQGAAPAFAETAAGNVLMNAIGTDIWDVADQFRFAYKTLNGNGTMIARVESIFNSNAWAKGGVMIRQNVEPGSTHAFMPITPGGSGAGNGASFQRRTAANGTSTNNDNTGAVVAAPYWVKIERNGNNFTGSISPDGKTWTQLGTAQTIPMAGPVLVGLALCSHDAAVATGAEFSNIAFTGNVTGGWQVAEIGAAQTAGNSAEGLYVTIKDSAGKSKTVAHPDTAATVRTGWQQWTIPLSEFTAAGVKMNAVKSMTIGVGNKAAPIKGGAGKLIVDDIGFGRPIATQ